MGRCAVGLFVNHREVAVRRQRSGPPSRGWRPFLLLLFSLLPWAIGCAGGFPPPSSASARLVENVPFYPQEVSQCGPASLAGVLNFWGIRISPAEIASELYSPSARGTLNLDLLLYAERKGMAARQYRGTLQQLKEKIDSGYPLIVLVDLGFWFYQQGHFMVVVGYDENGIIAHSGRERQKSIPFGKFLRTWERMQCWSLLVTPKP